MRPYVSWKPIPNTDWSNLNLTTVSSEDVVRDGQAETEAAALGQAPGVVACEERGEHVLAPR
jgi:hypothetical protein